VIIVSAADAAVNRFFGIKYGADYYIKKPFDPSVLKAFTNIFLRKHGKTFDPLVDLPDKQRLVAHIKQKLAERQAEFTKVDIEGIAQYEEAYGRREAKLITRLVSQMLQDKLNESEQEGMVGYLGENAFIYAAQQGRNENALSEIEADFRRISGFIGQKHGISGDLFEKLERGRTGGTQKFTLNITHYPINLEVFKPKFEEFIGGAGDEELNRAALNKYSMDQLREIVENSKVDVSIHRVNGNLKLTIGGVKKGSSQES